jgi:predicted 3-demethylubiquinone-9 3-methyltransferase (glyoxalase superfamily)
MIQKITPFLWFDNQAEEAMNFYVSIFKDSKVLSISRYGEGAPVPVGTVMTASFLIEGQEFTALNGGPLFSFTEAISFVIHCQTQEEVDHYWEKLTYGGEEVQCGWLKDKFGVSWQVVPEALGRLLNNPDPNKAQRAMQALFTMKKIDISQLQAAADRI